MAAKPDEGSLVEAGVVVKPLAECSGVDDVNSTVRGVFEVAGVLIWTDPAVLSPLDQVSRRELLLHKFKS